MWQTAYVRSVQAHKVEMPVAFLIIAFHALIEHFLRYDFANILNDELAPTTT